MGRFWIGALLLAVAVVIAVRLFVSTVSIPKVDMTEALSKKHFGSLSELSAFKFNGQPIHPSFLKDILGDISGAPPNAEEIVLLDRSPHLIISELPTQEFEGFLFINDPESNSAYGYRHLGITSGGVHVLDTWSNFGGTGFFYAIVFVKFDEREVCEEPDTDQSKAPIKIRMVKKTVLRCLGELVHGDRDDGEITLVGDTLTLGESRYRDTEKVLDLSDLH